MTKPQLLAILKEYRSIGYSVKLTGSKEVLQSEVNRIKESEERIRNKYAKINS
jgi:hypothetical protein